ncbi:hypothetical protein MMC07_005721 [Pseudocyphellaria aurata]|nr:hypothetical protein [Pseudocyphellaria aurata]
MATDRSLATLLRALQDASSEEQEVSRLLGSATMLLTILSNPLNLTLLTTQLLSAPAIWSRPHGLHTAVRVLSVFNSAGIQVLKNEQSSLVPNRFSSRTSLAKEDWITAVIKGADERTPRWRHLLALSGLLLGFEGQERRGISDSLRMKLESAIVKALNLALQEIESGDEVTVNGLVMTVIHVFSLLSEHQKNGINYDILLPRLYWAPFFSTEGLRLGYFLSAMDADIVEGPNRKFDWSVKSSTYLQVQRITSSPLIASLGSLSRVIAYSIGHVQNMELLLAVIDDILAFTKSLCIQWRQNKLSEIDLKEESTYLSDEAIHTSLPLVWRVLKSGMFSIVVILKSLLERVIEDATVPMDGAPHMAAQTLNILRDLYFISSHMGANNFSQYTFVYLTAIDILSQHPSQAEAFLREIRPAETGLIPEHPLDRCHDLYFLNTAEHFPAVVAAQVSEDLLIPAATPYLGVGGDHRLIEIFEAAHSMVLAVFSVPQNSGIIAKHIYPYFDALFKVFPQNLSSRQFRMAVRTLVRITSPPSPISADQPLLSSTILELIRKRSETALSVPLQRGGGPPDSEENVTEDTDVSEQCVLTLTIIDALPFLPIDLLEEWLPIAAETIHTVQDENMRNQCQQRFWDILSNGEMDANCAAVCVSWWSTRGGREFVLYGTKKVEDTFMSGGLGDRSKL